MCFQTQLSIIQSLKNISSAGGKILGGKTGYTGEAGLCLASIAIKDDKEYGLVTADARGNRTTEQYNITDALAVFNSL